MKSVRYFALCLVGALLSACATTDYGTRDVGQAVDDQSSSEAGLYRQMDGLEEKLANSGNRNLDPVLNKYVNDLACQTIGEYCSEVRVYILDIPYFNASMAANGMMNVYSGLLLRAEDEAQLVNVLGHEFGHYYENHSLEQIGAMKNANVTGTLVGAALTATGVPIIGELAYIGGLSTAFKFSREKEIEADLIGLERTVAAGYDPLAGVKLWQNLRDEYAASSNEAKREYFEEKSLFSTHPLTSERIEILKREAQPYKGSKRNAETYRAQIRPHMLNWLEAEIGNRDPGATLHLIDRLSKFGEDLGKLEYARGRVLSLRNEEGDLEAAIDAFLASSEHADAPPETWRNLGDHFAKVGDQAKSIDSFEAYLERAPNARDRALIQNILENTGEMS